MDLQMVYLLIETTPCNCICIELLKKMIKELEQNKEELRKIKELFDSKLEELEKKIVNRLKLSLQEKLELVSFFKCIALIMFINSTECCTKSV